jgi:SAM-dependent methyltransferase
MRNANCPICRQETEVLLQLRFGKKIQLPTEVEIRHCGHDNFAFLRGGAQSDYDQYYAENVNDAVHQEVADSAGSPISKLQRDLLVSALDGFFSAPRNVLDFGCGEGALLSELAANFGSSTFLGYEPGPAAHAAASKARNFCLDNLSIVHQKESISRESYDLVIASHVIEHIIDFGLLEFLGSALVEGGLLYVEAPDSLEYEAFERLEFLYYFDRLHVNHFTPRSLAQLMAAYGFGQVKHFRYAFPYRDGGEYPALGMLFRKGGEAVDVVSPSILEGMNRYIRREQERARVTSSLLNDFEELFVWGTGDNFYRSIENGGPLSNLRNMSLLDRRSHGITIGNRDYQTEEPLSSIRKHSWPIIVTISEGRREIVRQIAEVDPGRQVFFI